MERKPLQRTKLWSNTHTSVVQVRFPAEMDLGDMFISLAYVDRQIARDREEEAEAGKRGEGEGEGENGETEWWDGERGVSGAMSRVFDVQVGGNYHCTLLQDAIICGACVYYR